MSLDGIFLLSDFSPATRSDPATPIVFTFRVNGSSLGFLALGELNFSKDRTFNFALE